jgi:hypothetical protein
VAHIEKTSGWTESVLHLVQLGEMAIPVLAALFLEITSGVVLLVIALLILHEATAIWDVRYASTARGISPVEQHVHSVLEMLPLTGLLLVIAPRSWHCSALESPSSRSSSNNSCSQQLTLLLC